MPRIHEGVLQRLCRPEMLGLTPWLHLPCSAVRRRQRAGLASACSGLGYQMQALSLHWERGPWQMLGGAAVLPCHAHQ